MSDFGMNEMQEMQKALQENTNKMGTHLPGNRTE